MTIEIRSSLPRRDWIVLSEMSVSCVVGLHDCERRHLLSRPAPGEARAHVDCVWIKVTKPDIFGGRAVPSVEVLRDRAWLDQRRLTCSDHEGVAVDSLTETPETGAYHVSLEPGAEWPLLDLSTAQSIAGTLSIDDRRLAPGERCVAPNVLRADQGQRARVVVVGPRGIREGSHV